MSRIFLTIYDFLEKRRTLMFAFLSVLVTLMCVSLHNLRFEQDLMKMMPSSGDEDLKMKVFENLKVKDKTVILLSTKDKADISFLSSLSDTVAARLFREIPDYIAKISNTVSADDINVETERIYSNLPAYLDLSVYDNLQQRLTDESIRESVREASETLYGFSGMMAKDYIFRDPLWIGGSALHSLKKMKMSSSFANYNDHIFVAKDTVAVLYLSPSQPASDLNANIAVTETVERILSEIESQYSNVATEYFGGPSIAAYNSKQVRNDMNTTLVVSVTFIGIFIFLTLGGFRNLLLILLPGGFGFLFALSVASVLGYPISLIALGAASAIVGVVLSYSIHTVCHSRHCDTAKQLVSEMSNPMTLGSATTIGAFVSLLFTSSDLLRSFGLLSSLTIVGATIFCLVFLPHMLSFATLYNNSKLYLWIDKLNSKHPEKYTPLVFIIIALSVYGVFHIRDCVFDENLENQSYFPEKFVSIKNKLDSYVSEEGEENIYFVSVGKSNETARQNYAEMNKKLDSLYNTGLLSRHSDASSIIISRDEYTKRIEAWKNFWTEERVSQVVSSVKKIGYEYGFNEDAFMPFFDILKKEYSYDFDSFPVSELTDNWMSEENGMSMIVSNVSLDKDNKEHVYSVFENDEGVVILDKPYFMSKAMSLVNDDFNFVLTVSAGIVFLALLLAYGKIEIALLSFMPMAIGWLIILAFMSIFGLQFNIVSVIISTFIFGIGDDFSIFVTDGLVSEYKDGSETLKSHKIAIFFSSLTSIVGMGALVFSSHPSLKSVGTSSLIGMIAVVLSAYVIQPFLFSIFVTNRIKKDQPPISIVTILRFIPTVFLFFVCAILLSVLSLIGLVIPLPSRWKTDFIHFLMCQTCRLILFMTGVSARRRVENDTNEKFDKPAMVIANHQSVLDILAIMALVPKVVIMANGRNYNNPFYGVLLHMAGFFCSDDDPDKYLKGLKKLVSRGYSVCVFPEGYRTLDGNIDKFKAGAFYLAEDLQLDIVPIVFVGHYNVLRKDDILSLNAGIMIDKIFPRDVYVPAKDHKELRRKATKYHDLIKNEYDRLTESVTRPDVNPYFKERLVSNFLYKGPVLEYYVRIKSSIEKGYKVFDNLIPRSAIVTDIGCGYGTMALMLSLLSKDRKIVGIDYDEEKIKTAKHCYSCSGSLDYMHADCREIELPKSDVFVMSDMMHYMDKNQREKLFAKCVQNLNEDGKILIRDANNEETKSKHFLTMLSEWLSTSSLLNFNKTINPIEFFGETEVVELANKYGMSVLKIDNQTHTSNVIYSITKDLG